MPLPRWVGLCRSSGTRLGRPMPCRGWVTGAASLRACSSSAAGEHGVAAGDQLLQAGLHVVGTPIGNLQDLSPRALHVLRSVERILCEDTRHTAHLCSYFDVHTPLESLHEHNELAKCAKVCRQGERECRWGPTQQGQRVCTRGRCNITRIGTGSQMHAAVQQRSEPSPNINPACQVVRELTLGTSLALVSDAGLPAVSDPGGRLIAAAVEAGVPIIPVPGRYLECRLVERCHPRGAPEGEGFGARSWARTGNQALGLPSLLPRDSAPPPQSLQPQAPRRS